MSGPADLTITNQTSGSLVIQGHTITTGATYTVAFGDLVTFAQDPFLRVCLLSNQVYITALGVPLKYKDAADFLDKVARASIVYGS